MPDDDMLGADREWHAVAGASSEALQKLKSVLGEESPASYLDFLAYSNGGEGPLDVQPFNLCLDSAETVTANAEQGAFAEFFPGFVVIGGNGGGEFIAFDVRQKGVWEVVAIDMINTDLSESVLRIAKDFSEFMRHIGIESEDA